MAAGDCRACGGEGFTFPAGAEIEYDPVHDETYGGVRCADCEGSGEFPLGGRVYDCPGECCDVVVWADTLGKMIEAGIPCKCGSLARNFRLVAVADEPDPDYLDESLWTVADIISWRDR